MARTATPTTCAEPIGSATTRRFERRRRPRWEAIGSLQGYRWDLTAPSIDVELRLLDESEGGVGALVSSPLPAGAELHVCTSPESDLWRTGVVVRCAPLGDRYRVGVAFRT